MQTGEWCVYRLVGDYRVCQIAENPPRNVLATFPDREKAEQLLQAIDGARGQRNERLTRAHRDFEATVARLADKATWK